MYRGRGVVGRPTFDAGHWALADGGPTYFKMSVVKLDAAFVEAVYTVTKMIPKGQVATYAQIATYVVSPRYARAVGRALKDLGAKRGREVPWQRVINSAGRISARGDVSRPDRQRRLLEKEGIVFSESGRVNLAVFGWAGPPPTWRPPYADPAPAKNRRRAGRG